MEQRKTPVVRFQGGKKKINKQVLVNVWNTRNTRNIYHNVHNLMFFRLLLLKSFISFGFVLFRLSLIIEYKSKIQKLKNANISLAREIFMKLLRLSY